MRYEIEETTNAVRIFADGREAPTIFQPNYPNGQPWESAAAAATWAQLYIASIEDESAPYAPAEPGVSGRAKPTAEEIAEMEALRAEMYPNFDRANNTELN